ncbi:MAG: transcription antitermination factor NusB [Phycisphaerae bacterium]
MNNGKKWEDVSPTDWRAQARALAMQCLTQLDVQGTDFLMEMDSFIAEANAPSDSKSLAGELARVAWNNHEPCDQFIGETVKHWQLQRIALIDRAIFRLAIAEMLYRTDVPVKVVLDQAIELAKRFSTAESPQFINGVLDAIAKKIQEPSAAAETNEIEKRRDREGASIESGDS